jgi:hypothetical protein
MFVRPKGKRKLAAPIPPQLIEPLRRHLAGQDAERQAAGLARCRHRTSQGTSG